MTGTLARWVLIERGGDYFCPDPDQVEGDHMDDRFEHPSGTVRAWLAEHGMSAELEQGTISTVTPRDHREAVLLKLKWG